MNVSDSESSSPTRRLLVVGASSGIGRATVVAAAARGHRVVAVARRLPELEWLASEAGAAVSVDVLDLRDPTACEAVVTRAIRELGSLDAVVIAAGATHLGGVAETDHPTWSALLEVNLVGPALVARAALPALESSRGRILFMSSVTVDGAWPGLVPYAAAKAGLETLAKGLQQEHPDVAVTTLVVGPTDTTVNDHWDSERARAAYRRWRERGLMGRRAMQPTDVAELVMDVVTSPVRVPFLSVEPHSSDPRSSRAHP